MKAARQHGTVVSYDLNYRESLWQVHWRPERRRKSTAISCR